MSLIHAASCLLGLVSSSDVHTGTGVCAVEQAGLAWPCGLPAAKPWLLRLGRALPLVSGLRVGSLTLSSSPDGANVM